MPRRALHGIAIETRSALADDPAEHLFARLPAARGGETDVIVVETRVATSATDLAPRHPRSAAAEDGALSLHAGGGEIEAAAPGALVRVAAGGARLDAFVDPRVPSAHGHAFAEVPLLAALLAALRPRGLFHLHAAALVLEDGRSVLVAGPGGSGKSTLAAALVLAGASYLGDDAVLVAVRGGAPRLLALPRDFHLAPLSARAIPGAPLEPRRTLSGKHPVDPRTAFPGRARDEAGAPALLLRPRVGAAPRTTLAPLSQAEAFAGLLECSAFAAAPELAGGRAHLDALARIAEGAPAFAADLGRDLLADAACTARRLLAEALR
jgi:hypothetical protein